MIFLTMFLGK